MEQAASSVFIFSSKGTHIFRLNGSQACISINKVDLFPVSVSIRNCLRSSLPKPLKLQRISVRRCMSHNENQTDGFVLQTHNKPLVRWRKGFGDLRVECAEYPSLWGEHFGSRIECHQHLEQQVQKAREKNQRIDARRNTTWFLGVLCSVLFPAEIE